MFSGGIEKQHRAVMGKSKMNEATTKRKNSLPKNSTFTSFYNVPAKVLCLVVYYIMFSKRH